MSENESQLGECVRVVAALMAAMGCKIEEDSPEGPCCAEPSVCGGHGTLHYCVEHDWFEDGNTALQCGYAAMLATQVQQVISPTQPAAVHPDQSSEPTTEGVGK